MMQTCIGDGGDLRFAVMHFFKAGDGFSGYDAYNRTA